ncbi:penicillin acylase family protein [Brevibacillus humidisoli]|uniref:penicillin acylase family protein n=1 Tax=Brevibacillus humidisoli TaxID=2895522 RepID=UPI001E383709|nr:penicillin acylase family protein [Brevibacillus humidisoli]UFJ41459.1 penicillin acylase family protein [Brevibacillus humidisoli]
MQGGETDAIQLQQAVRNSMSQTSGEINLPGLQQNVTVYRDERGVPHIEAASLSDLYMAQGFVTAQDRLWQMDMSRRLTSGRMAEVFGPDYVPSDLHYRKLQLSKAAEESLDRCSAAVREILERFSAGINAYIRQASEQGSLPLEFVLLDYQPEPWTPLDTMLIGKLLAASLSENLKAEIYRDQLRSRVGDERAKELWPVYPEDGYVTIPSGDLADGCTQLDESPLLPENKRLDLSGLLRLLSGSSQGNGSNGWVVSGKLTKSGKPLLANDPHLDYEVPAIWYQTHLNLQTEAGERLNVIGVTLPGVPGIVLGHNDQIAWGVTNAIADTQDLFLEKFHPANLQLVMHQGKWEDVTVVRETIRVRGGADIPLDVRITRHGPILTEVESHDDPDAAVYGLALRWTAYGASAEIEAFLELNKAKNWEECRECLRKIESPVLNVLFAAVDGTIALRTAGSIPIRARGDGLVPVPGWTDEYEWNGFIPFEEMPEVVNPEQGFIVSANNKITDDAYPYLISAAWDTPYRAKRIADQLQRGRELTVEEMSSLQGDLANEQADTILPILLEVLQRQSLSPDEQEAVHILKTWDRLDEAHQAAPLLYHVWDLSLRKHLYEPQMGADLYALMADGTNVTDQMLRRAAEGQESSWIKEAGEFDLLVYQSFQAALQHVISLQGHDSRKWRWGDYHQLRFAHPLSSLLERIGATADVPAYPVGGSRQTVCLMGFAESGRVLSGASWRQVVDLAALDRQSYDILTPGQSGQVGSRWYADQAPLHVKGELRPQLFRPEEYRTGEKLVLHP